MQKRVIWFVLDSFGIGKAPDAATFGDEGADTFGHIAECFMDELGRPIELPNLGRLGLYEAYQENHERYPLGIEPVEVVGDYAVATEVSTGKDTPSGHWEMAGVPVTWDWGYFPVQEECFPEELLEEIYEKAGLEGSIGHCHSSGTVILEKWGEESVASGRPIFYTSADSVFQIAAHEEHFGLDRLYRLCEVARELLNERNVGRVIARPFVGTVAEGFVRTGNRKDYAVTPLVMTNFVDFDMRYGHRRDPEGYGLALEEWDRELGAFLLLLGDEDLLVITADHGNDPTWEGSDHTRERVPVLMYNPRQSSGASLGIWESFAEIGKRVEAWLKLADMS